MKLENKNEAFKVLALAALVLGFALALPGCGPGRIVRGDPDRPCTVTKEGSVATISCPDGSTTTISDGATGANGSDGQTGADGQDGSDGANGHSAIASQAPATSCANGGTTISLGVDLNDNSQLDSNEITQTITVCNGVNGQDGQDGNNGNSGNGNNGNHNGHGKKE